MYILYISKDFGKTYQKSMISERLIDFKDVVKSLDMRKLRWTIENEEGDIIVVCKVFKEIVELARRYAVFEKLLFGNEFNLHGQGD